ncbi:MAG: UDP-N-acetylmuramoyl-L-alanine--D-glutamate ligase [Planctomyces sp.]|nr:UDP-N-acetylmuramoyl-L-alanine--D-glutamate ligase [Planctomyces sp.]
MSPPPVASPRIDAPGAGSFRNARVTVMGLGAFGGGEGVVRFLSQRGARITITDLRSETDLADTLARLDDCRIESLQLGAHHEPAFREADLIVVNPAVPRGSPWLDIARAAGVPLTSEMNLFAQHHRGRVVAVTGSIGKSTTTALLHAMLAASGRRAWLGGNIGVSLLPVVDDIEPGDWVVLELSSFQLTDLDRLRFRPDVAVVTNLRPNHLDWHASLDEYRQAKQTILRWQQPTDVAVLNADDADVASWPAIGRKAWFGREGATVAGASTARDDSARVRGSRLVGRVAGQDVDLDLQDGFRLPGEHHAINAAAATAAALTIGADTAALRSALRAFEGLPHRLQRIDEQRGRAFFDDSKATTPDAAIAALRAFEAPVILLAGGYDKHVDLSDLADAIAERAAATALMGQTAEALDALLAERRTARGEPPKRRVCATFEEAFSWGVDQSSPGDVVLLSPGCASFGWFQNYVERGREFARLAREWGEGLGAS